MPAPHFSLSAKDRLRLVLEAHEGSWQSVGDLMFEAGFVPTRRDRLTPFTSFYSSLCLLKDAGAAGGYRILHEDDRVMLWRSMPA